MKWLNYKLQIPNHKQITNSNIKITNINDTTICSFGNCILFVICVLYIVI